jgi:PIN domain nuclease of toxin-antitoxin system
MALERRDEAMSLHLDTHVALWLAAGDKRRLRPVAPLLARGVLFVSPIVVVEMELLREIGRIRGPVSDVLEVLTEDHGVSEAPGEAREIGHHARLLGWTRDPFDRLIVAHALASRATLLTADETILDNCAGARWT